MSTLEERIKIICGASAQSHAIVMRPRAEGEPVMVYVQYHLEFKRVDCSWRIQLFSGEPLMPLE